MGPPDLEHRACLLVQGLTDGCTQRHGIGSFTPAIYDTAWVSMISKVEHGETRWLFPESFQYLLNSQLPNGGWESQDSCDDGVLNTLAALLAMKKHSHTLPDGVEFRIPAAIDYLRGKLQKWDADTSIHVGFEILIPTLLAMLNEEQVVLPFPDYHRLMALNHLKLKKFNPDILYGEAKTTLLHSLEGFIGRLDFNKVRHHLTDGHMMASPASTAAYLMKSSVWDDEAETYLRNTVTWSAGKGNGGVPSAYPTPIFEISWVLSTLLHAGYTVEDLGVDRVSRLGSYLEKHLEAQHGLLGFAPLLVADADDTARASYTLSLLGRATKLDSMLETFKTAEDHVQTYVGERNPSISANCNVLIALLHAPEPRKYSAELSSIATFLCESWWSNNVEDKWNVSPQYSMMLLAEALTRLLYLRDSGQLPLLPEELTTNRVPTVLVQICNRTLFCQSSHGSWGANNSTEITAYAVITLVAISSLPFLQQLEKEILAALKTGRQFLSRSSERWDEAQHIWIEKTSYGSPVLSEAYCLAAMKCSTLSHTWSDHLARPPCLTKITKFFSVLPLFSKELVWKLKASVLEGSMFIKQLKSARLEIFREPLGAENKYLEFIPCTWTVMNNCNALFLSTNILWDMMQVSMLDFLVDEYMESTVAQLPEEGINSLGHIIRSLCHESEAQAKKSRKRTYSEHSNGDIAKVCVPSANRDSYSHIIKIKVTLRRYIRWVLNHPRVTSASQSDQAHLRGELQAFLLAHLIQIQDNNRFSQQGPQCGDSDSIPAFLTPRTPFYTWVHTTAADHISCPLSFAFYACIVSATFPTVSDCFPSARHKYLAQDLCTHLSIMSRLYNDFASVARDRAERNLNSVNFPEFHTPPPHSLVDESVLANMDRLKREVLLLAEYERECVRGAESALRACVLAGGRRERGVASAVRLFVAVTELYAEMYVVKDLTNRVK